MEGLQLCNFAEQGSRGHYLLVHYQWSRLNSAQLKPPFGKPSIMF